MRSHATIDLMASSSGAHRDLTSTGTIRKGNLFARALPPSLHNVAGLPSARS